VTAEGHEYDYHGSVEKLKQAHPGAAITGVRVTNAITGESHYEPYMAEAKTAAKADPVAVAEKPAPKPRASAKKDDKA
ncbi:MAG: hypothetical protein AB7G34_11260, partial [Hyphomicrobiales bacterium]